MSMRCVSYFLTILCVCVFSFNIQAVDLSASLKAKLNNMKALNSKNEKIKNAAQFYKRRNFKQIWLEGDTFTSAAERVLEILENAAIEGLDSGDYARAHKLVLQGKGDPSKLLDAEIALSSLAMEYIDDVLGERLNPRKISKILYLKIKNIDAVQIMSDGMSNDPSAEWLGKLTINHSEYQMLKKALANYRARKEQTNYPKLSLGAKIKLGSKGGRVETLQWQLSALGYLKESHSQGSVDEVTLNAVKKFQEENSLIIDGWVGPKTVRALNSYNFDDRIKQLIVSMERWRWLPEDLGSRYIKVNIASFELTAFEEGVEKLRMPVIIGRNYRKTPVFSSAIDSVRFNPPWNVPRSIAIKDKLKKIKRDPGYLTRGGYVLYDSSGGRINPYRVDWSSVSASNFDYRIRQNPGSDNALGKIRFSIKSPFNVYLHSTPDKHLFNESVRSFSSGCIRVGNPKELAFFVFDDESIWSLKRISSNMEGTKTKNISLAAPVSVYITYFTVWKNKENQLYFSQDIYGQDQAIWNALQKRKNRKN